MAGPIGGYDLLYDDTKVYQDGSGMGWNQFSTNYQTVNITKDTHVSPAFYSWFMANSKKIEFSPVLNDNSWEMIALAADRGVGQNYWSVGDTKEVTLNGSVGYGSSQATFNNTKYWVYIIGFDHNSSKEGTGIAFQGFKTAQTGGVDICVVTSNYLTQNGTGMVMNATNTNTGGWAGSVAYKTIMPQWKAVFPSDLQAVIKSTTLYTDDVGNQSTAASSVKASSNEVYYLAEYEAFGARTYANTNEAAQQQQYAYYKAGNSKVKYKSDSTSTAAYWWLRSPSSGSSRAFCFVGAGGAALGTDADFSLGVAPAFKVGSPPPLTGEWVFNSTLDYADIEEYVDFISNGTDYVYMKFSAGVLSYDQTEVYNEASAMDPGWSNSAYRTITFTTPFKYESKYADFYDWFVANAVKQ